MKALLAAVSRLVLRYHRWLGLLAALPVIVWGLSGLSHPVMTRLQPQPAAMTPPAGLFALTPAARDALPPLSSLLTAQGMAQVQEARLLQWQGRAVWRVTPPGEGAEPVYLDAADGKRLPGLDRDLAIALARHYAGEPQRAVVSATRITRFTPEYAYVNRLLPVWRVEFDRDDHLRAYVETGPFRLATLDDDAKALFTACFRNLHSWAFIGNEALRDTLMTFFLLSAMAASLGGLWLYGFFWRAPRSGERARPVRRAHRMLGVGVALSTLTFTLSAVLHLQLLEKGRNDAPPLRMPVAALASERLTLLPSALAMSPGESVELLSLQGEPVWRIAPAPVSRVGKRASVEQGEHEHHHRGGGMPVPTGERYVDAAGQTMPDAARRMALALAGQASGQTDASLHDVTQVTRFEGEYGFINKRLPVWRVAYDTPDHLAVYVESATGIVASQVRDAERLEGFSFAYLHKGHWMDALGKGPRDTVLGVFALLNAVVALLGLLLWRRRLLARRRMMPPT